MSLLARVPNFPKLAFSNVGCTFSHFTKDMENWDFSIVADMLYFPNFQISQRVWKLGVLNNSLSFTSQFSQLKHFLFFLHVWIFLWIFILVPIVIYCYQVLSGYILLHHLPSCIWEEEHIFFNHGGSWFLVISKQQTSILPLTMLSRLFCLPQVKL